MKRTGLWHWSSDCSASTSIHWCHSPSSQTSDPDAGLLAKCHSFSITLHMDSVGVAAVGAGAALLSSALTGRVTYLVTRTTLEHDATQLASRLASEHDAAREEREQERREKAYVSLLEYTFWLSDANAIHHRVVTRQHDAIAALRPSGRLPTTEEEAAAEEAAFLGAGPIAGEQERLDAGPTSKDNAATWALVTALSSNAVLSAFEELMECDAVFSSKLRSLQNSLLHKPQATAGVGTTGIAQTAKTATEQIEAAARTFEAVVDVIDAHEKFQESFKKIEALVRAELDQTRAT